jgi:AmmeMemoRadiSam system protein A
MAPGCSRRTKLPANETTGTDVSATSETEPADDRSVLDRHGLALLRIAAASIEYGLQHHRPLTVDASSYPRALRREGASFVTLKQHGGLRGCVGSVEAYRPIVDDVAANGFAAAFRDSRFSRLTAEERFGLSLSVSVLSVPQPLCIRDEDDLLAQLHVGVDGLVIRCDDRRALFLPQVWEMLSEPREFLGQLKVKAGLSRDYWSEDVRASRFATASISSDSFPTVALWS